MSIFLIRKERMKKPNYSIGTQHWAENYTIYRYCHVYSSLVACVTNC